MIEVRLRELLAKHGRELCGDTRRCESMIRDICGDKTKEAHLLIQALKQQVAADLMGIPKDSFPLPELGRLTKRLEDSLGLAHKPACWAVETWALAIGVPCQTDLQRENIPNSKVSPPPPKANLPQTVPAKPKDRQPISSTQSEPSWLVTEWEFAETTRQFWLGGSFNSFCPKLQDRARHEPRDVFLNHVLNNVRFMKENKFPFFKNEAWIGGGGPQSMRLTSYRLILTLPSLGIRAFPLKDIAHYSFKGVVGSFRYFFLGSAVKLYGPWGDFYYKGPQLKGLCFPHEPFVENLIRMRCWDCLPHEAHCKLGSRN